MVTHVVDSTIDKGREGLETEAVSIKHLRLNCFFLPQMRKCADLISMHLVPHPSQ